MGKGGKQWADVSLQPPEGTGAEEGTCSRLQGDAARRELRRCTRLQRRTMQALGGSVGEEPCQGWMLSSCSVWAVVGGG